MSEDRVLSAFQSLESALVTGLWEIKAALRAREELKNAVVTSEREKDDRIHILERENKVLREAAERQAAYEQRAREALRVTLEAEVERLRSAMIEAHTILLMGERGHATLDDYDRAEWRLRQALEGNGEVG